MLKEFKRRLKLEKLLQGSIYGLSAGLFSAAISIVIFQLLNILEWYIYLVSIGVGLFIYGIILFVYYLFNRVNDKAVANRIDKSFSLREKASTMVEFEGKDSLIINKQREDAKKSIKLRSPRKLVIKVTMASLPLPLIGAGAFTTSIFTQNIVNMIKAEEVEDNYDDETDEIIDSIKDYVGKSQASAAFKEKIFQLLEELRIELKGDTDILSRLVKINKAKAKVDEALDEVNSKEEIGEAAAKDENSLSTVGEIIGQGNVDEIESSFDNFNKDIDAIVSTSGLLNVLKEWINDLSNLLSELESLGVPTSDSNYKTFSDLLAKLKAIYDNVEDKLAASGSATTALVNQLIRDSQEQVKKAIEEAISNLKSDITLEKANDELAENVKRLMDQLVDPESDKVDTGDIEEGGQGDDEGPEGDVGDEGNQETTTDEGEEGGAEGGQGNGDGNKGDGSGTGSGGQDGEGQGQGQGEGASGGGGETEYGSNDKVYTGENGETSYGEVIGDYQNDASDDAKNTGDDNLEGAIGDYFDELYGEGSGNTNP